MSTQRIFQLSFYVTLGMACACLASAETFFLSWMEIFLAVALVLVGVAYWTEGRWSLSLTAANFLGLFIAVGAAGWILFNLPRTEEDLRAGGVPWPAGLLPHLGPLLVVLLLVKLFRPKQIADFWVLQTIGLMMVTLGCVLAGDPFFGVLLVFFLGSLVWCLALFYLVCEQAKGSATDPKLLPLFLVPDKGAPLPWRRMGLGPVSRWTAFVVTAGMVAFLVAPRQGNSQWLPHQLSNASKKLRSGMEDGIDLNRLGTIELSNEPAFEVFALTNAGPFSNLPSEMRWHVDVLEHYERGNWLNHQQAENLQMVEMIERSPVGLVPEEGFAHPKIPPGDMPNDAIYLSFRVPGTNASKPLAYPLGKHKDLGIRPYLGNSPSALSFFQRVWGRDSVITAPAVRRPHYSYGQIIEKWSDPDLVPARDLGPGYRKVLLDQKVPEQIGEWVRTLLDRLPGLSPADRKLDARNHVPASNHRRVARALSNHLAQSGEFGYSLSLRRDQLKREPTVDFLLYTKEGHCERFAGGLALMLRSVGIPARVVNGYHGLENRGPGHYLVRQGMAHSWVQALVEEPPGTGLSWLTLDPTPSADSSESNFFAFLDWFNENWSDTRKVWRTFVMEFNADQQRSVTEAILANLGETNWRSWPMATAALLAAGACLVVGRKAWTKFAKRRGSKASAAGSQKVQHVEWYESFLALLADRLRIEPQSGETPLEFGRRAWERLTTLLLPEKLVQLPCSLANLLYEIRFGGRTLSAEQSRQLQDDIAHLAKVLAEKGSAEATVG